MLYPHIEHHGAVDGVTGSCHQLHMDADSSLLIDCGLFQGAEVSSGGRAGVGLLDIDFPLAGVKALVATHVHIDHVGRLPWLLAAGFDGPIICSEPSARLLPITLEDAFRLGMNADQKQIERYIKLVEQRLQPLAYNQRFTLQESEQLSARVRLQRAGHILGSAYVEIDLSYPASGEQKRIVFSGDLGAAHAPLLTPPSSPECADVLCSSQRSASVAPRNCSMSWGRSSTIRRRGLWERPRTQAAPPRSSIRPTGPNCRSFSNLRWPVASPTGSERAARLCGQNGATTN